MLTKRQITYLANLPKEIGDKAVKIFPWDKHGIEVAQRVINDIKSVESTLEVFLRGSVPLKIAGQKDIDLTCCVLVSQIPYYQDKFNKFFNKNGKLNEDSVVWHFIIDGYEVGFYIIDPTKSDQMRRQNCMHNLFMNSPKLLLEYEQLKLSLNNVPYKHYLEKKFEFFNRLIGE